jgi:DNA adenine methylase
MMTRPAVRKTDTLFRPATRKSGGKLIKYAGGKNYLARWIISRFPVNYRDMTYLEPFFGSGAVFFNKEPSDIETINDLSDDIVNLFKQVRDNHKELLRQIRYSPWSREEYNLSIQEADNDMERARRFLFRMWMTIGACTHRQNGMRTLIKRGSAGDLKNFQANIKEAVEQARDRLIPLSGIVQIENRDALVLVKKYNKPNVLMYLDPPYIKSARPHHPKIYKHEMTDEDHERLLEEITTSRAKVIISGYESELYNKYLSGWRTDKKYIQNDGHIARVEYLWMNYDPPGEYLFDIDAV